MYGHAYGDVALKVLSEGMQKFFDKNVVLGRNGGDEFCIFQTAHVQMLRKNLRNSQS